MGKSLHALGLWAFKNKWWVMSGWLVVIALLGWAALTFIQPTSSSISIPGTNAQKTLDRFNELFPSTGSQSGRIVIEAPQGKTIQDYAVQVNELSKKVAEVPEITTSVTPFENPSTLSKDKTIGYITAQIMPEDQAIKAENITKIQEAINETRKSGLTVESGGDLVNKELGELIGVGEIGGVAIALIVLVITLGSLVAAGLPIIIAILTVGISMAGLFALSEVITIDSTSPALAVMLGLAVGIDYSLFIINRYQTFLKEGFESREAAGKSIATAGNAVIFAAITVIIALSSLAVVQIPFMTTMGLAAAATVAMAAIISITLIPALLGLVGLRIFGKKVRKQVQTLQSTHTVHKQAVSHKTIWYRWGQALLQYRKRILVAALLIITVMALPISQLQLGLPTDETAAPTSSARKSYDLLTKGFGAGYNGPLLVVVEGLPAVSDTDKAAVREQILVEYQKQQPMTVMTIEQQQAATQALEAQVETLAPYYQLNLVAQRAGEIENVTAAQPILTTDNGTKGVIQITPSTGPSDSATKELVTYLRKEDTRNKLTQSADVTLGITGSTAIQIDINNKLAAALPVYLAVVVGLSLILLMIAFRSILIPIKATLGFLLSVLAMFGALVAVFQWGWFGVTDATGPIVSFIPIIAIGILFGLAMDYEFFLVSSMQEAYHQKKNAQKAILRGFALGSRVVVAAGLIMISVFAGFFSNHDNTIQAIGFALSVGILVDAFLVRMVIVPIVMSLLGDKAWWLPKWLDKRLPRVSIEGES